ncbi:MAG: hypothetical protein JNL98_23415 [Bryobacterales bacterium]|nr:hypothetical protein [Bryobacterales bacterium]
MRIGALLFCLSLLANRVTAQIVIPFVDCVDISSETSGETVIVGVIVNPGFGPSWVTRDPVQRGSRVTFNPGGATEETFQMEGFSGGTTSVGSSSLQFVHNVGERVVWTHRLVHAWFGYFNPTNADITYAAGGSQNFFTPGLPNQGQPSVFPPGMARRILRRPFRVDRDYTWIVGSQVTIARNTPEQYCTSNERLSRATPLSATLPRGQTSLSVPLATVNTADSVGALTVALTPHTEGVTAANPVIAGGVLRADVTVDPAAESVVYLGATYSANGRVVASTSTGIQVTSTCNATFSPQTLPAGALGGPYGPVDFSANNGTANATGFTLEGSLPVGMQFSGARLSGTPAAAGTFALRLNANFAGACTASTSYNLFIGGPACATNITSEALISIGAPRRDALTGRWAQVVNIRYNGATPRQGPIVLALDGLSSNAALVSSQGVTSCATPAGSPFVLVNPGSDGVLSPGEFAGVTLVFSNTSTTAPITYTPRLLAGGAQQ